MDIFDLTDPFVCYLRDERKFSEHTIKMYLDSIKKFFLAFNITSVPEITFENYSTFRDSLLQQKNSNKTKNLHLRALKSFLRFKVSKRVDLNLYPDQVEFFSEKGESKIPPLLPEKELNLFLNSRLNPRDDALVNFMAVTGLRAAELLNLNVKDIGERFTIRGKGKKIRIVFVIKKVLDMLLAYLATRAQNRPDDPLFINSFGHRLRYDGLREIFVKRSIDLSLSRKANPHMLRHSYATKLLNAGAPIYTVKELLGHSSIQTTERYLHLTNNQLEEAYSRCFPDGTLRSEYRN